MLIRILAEKFEMSLESGFRKEIEKGEEIPHQKLCKDILDGQANCNVHKNCISGQQLGIFPSYIRNGTFKSKTSSPNDPILPHSLIEPIK